MELTNRIHKYWNERSKEFCNLRMSELNSDKRELWKKEIKSHLSNVENLKVLDVGTGTGFFAIIMASLGAEVTGIDLSEKMIENAKSTSKLLGYDIDFKVMNAQELDFDDAYFDIIISRNLTWTLPDVQKAYKEWHRILKKDGKLVNFDADYGHVSFSEEARSLDMNHAHSKIDNNTLRECDDIKDKLNVSKKIRPGWDIEILNDIGFSDCKSDYTVSNRIYCNEDEFCNPTKMFSICAVK